MSFKSLAATLAVLGAIGVSTTAIAQESDGPATFGPAVLSITFL